MSKGLSQFLYFGSLLCILSTKIKAAHTTHRNTSKTTQTPTTALHSSLHSNCVADLQHICCLLQKNTYKGNVGNQSTPTTPWYSRNPKVLGELGNTIALRAKRKIKKGEELTISYVPFFRFLIIPLMFYIDQVQMAFVVHLRSLRVLSLKFTRPRNVLRQELISNWNFSCQCIRWTSFKDF